MDIRAAIAADREAIESVVAAAFDEPVDGRVVQMIRALDRSEATRSRLVADDDGVVGYVQLSRAWIDTRASLVDALTLTPLAVAPSRHGEGVGTALVAAAIESADSLGFPAIVLEGDWNYYGARGFIAADEVGLLPPSERIPGPGFQVRLLASHRPSMVGRFVYPDALWTSDCVGLRDPHLGEVEESLRT